MTTKSTYNEEKFKELVLYISRRSEHDQAFGAIKLNKLLVFSDFYSFRLDWRADNRH